MAHNVKLIHNGTQREIDSMPHSSLALLQRQSTHNKSKTLHSSRQSQQQPQPQPTFIFPSSTRGIFSPPLPAPLTSYYWLIDGVVGHDTGKLFLQAMVINGSVDGFEQLGSDLIIVDNPNSSVEQWIHRSIRLPFTNNSFTSNEGIGQMNGYLYMMGKCNGTSACLSRVIEKDIAAATTNDPIHYTIEYFSGPNNGIWSSNASDSTVLLPISSLRSTMATSAPPIASAVAQARPTPIAPPVTRAFFPKRSNRPKSGIITPHLSIIFQ